MPKRLAIGFNLGLFVRRIGQKASRSISRKSHKAIHRACLDGLEGRTLFSSYIVATWGSDSGPGTLAQPFRTIQEAANVAYAGDVVEIEGGTYRETVTPPHSGVTFTNYDNESVTVSGADPVTGFTQYSGSIYEATSATNWGEGDNQIFVDGVMLNEARFPNTSLDLSHPTEDTIGSYSNNTIYDSSLTQPAGYWTGALIHIAPGSEWVNYTGTVTNSGPGWITVSLPSVSSSYELPTAGNPYYLFGKFQALDTAGEWYMDSSNHLYVWDQYGDNVANHDVEIKDRQYGFDLSNVANTIIQGINLFACTINTGYGSTDTTLNGINASYITQFTNAGGSGWAPPAPYGIALWGAGSVIENSTIAYSAGDGVFVGGNNVTVNNNIIHDVDYSGTDAAGVRAYGDDDVIENNTIYDTGRDGINFTGGGDSILSNTVHDCALQTDDAGGIYTVNNSGGGTIAYNTVYNVNSAYNVGAGLYGTAGIFLDNNSANFVVHNNITENDTSGLRMNYTSYNENVYSNEFAGNDYAIDSDGSFNWSGTQIYDNTFYNANTLLGTGYTAWSNTVSGGAPALPPPTTTIVAPVSPPVTVSPPPVSPPPVSPPPAPASPPPAAAPAPPSTLATSLWNNTVIPSANLQNIYDPNIAGDGGVELGLKIRSSVAGSITGVRFFKGSLNTGTHTGELWSDSGQLLATAVFTNESASGWQQVSFSTPVAILANTTYIVAYHTTASYITYGANAFANAGVTNDQLTALQNGVDGANSVYRYGASAFPNQSSGNAPSYAVDVVFSAATTATTTTTSTTSVAGTTAATVWSSSTAPGASNQNVYDPNIAASGGVELGMKFQSDVAGSVTGVEFWKGGGESGVQTGELWTASGQLLATATFSNESGSGWQIATFSSPVTIAAGTTYIISYHTTSSLISYTPGSLSSGVNTGVLDALASGASGGNGIYAYGASSVFPTQYNGQSGSYWVQPIFQAS